MVQMFIVISMIGCVDNDMKNIQKTRKKLSV